MNHNKLLLDFVKQVRVHPNVTAFKLDEKIVTNAQFVQRVAPIMNELDTMTTDCIAILLEKDVQTYAAIVACILSNKVVIPIKKEWTESQVQDVLSAYGLVEFLTANRMNYYYWMTVDDAIDRIDNGLIQIVDSQVVAAVTEFHPDGTKTCRQIHASEVESLNVVRFPFL